MKNRTFICILANSYKDGDLRVARSFFIGTYLGFASSPILGGFYYFSVGFGDYGALFLAAVG